MTATAIEPNTVSNRNPPEQRDHTRLKMSSWNGERHTESPAYLVRFGLAHKIRTGGLLPWPTREGRISQNLLWLLYRMTHHDGMQRPSPSESGYCPPRSKILSPGLTEFPRYGIAAIPGLPASWRQYYLCRSVDSMPKAVYSNPRMKLTG